VNTEEGRAKICFKQVNVSGVRLCTKDWQVLKIDDFKKSKSLHAIFTVRYDIVSIGDDRIYEFCLEKFSKYCLYKLWHNKAATS
jgi:hypothetical protein